MDLSVFETEMRIRYEMIHGPGSWERMQERRRLEHEEYLRQEAERKRLLEEEENRRKLWKQQQEENKRRERLYLRSMPAFMKAQQGFCFDRSGTISSQALYDLYDNWCREQGIFPETPRNFLGWLKQNSAILCIRPCQNLPTPDGRRVRGFRGIAPSPEEST